MGHPNDCSRTQWRKHINHVVLTVSASLKAREKLSGKPLPHTNEFSLGRKYLWNYRAEIDMLSYLQGSTHRGISMPVHQCARFFNNPRLVQKRAIRRIEKYLVNTSVYVNLPDIKRWLNTHVIVYRTDIEKCIECYLDAELPRGWDLSYADNAENVLLLTGYVITYAGCPVLWCSRLPK